MKSTGYSAGTHTRRAHLAHKIYPYLLRGVPVVRPNPVWRARTITYLRLAHGWACLVAIIDGYS